MNQKSSALGRPPILIFLAVILSALAGCATDRDENNNDPYALFQKKHPVEARQYTHLYPVNLESYKVLDQLRSDRVSDIVVLMKQKYSDVTGLEDYADKILKADSEMWKNVERQVAEIGEACEPGTLMYEFEWSDGLKAESGLLVLKQGEVVKREVWATHDVQRSDTGK